MTQHPEHSPRCPLLLPPWAARLGVAAGESGEHAERAEARRPAIR